MRITKSALKKLIKEAALEYINSQQNLLAEKDLPGDKGATAGEELSMDEYLRQLRADVKRLQDAEAKGALKLSPEQQAAADRRIFQKAVEAGHTELPHPGESYEDLVRQGEDPLSKAILRRARMSSLAAIGHEDGELGRKPKSLAFFIKNKEIWGTRPVRGATDDLPLLQKDLKTMSIEELHDYYMFYYASGRQAQRRREPIVDYRDQKKPAGSLKETVLNHTNSRQNLLAEASDDGLKQLWSMFEDWHRYGMGRWDEAMYPTEVAAALQNMYSNRRGHMLKYVEMALGRKNKNLKLAQKEANKLFSKAIKTESFLSRLSESGSDRKVTKQLLRNAKTILKVANNHFSKTSSPSGSPIYPKLEAIVAKYAGARRRADDLDDL